MIYDANNGTKDRREAIANKFHDRGIHVIMLGIFSAFDRRALRYLLTETMCDNNEIVEANIRSVKISSPDVSPSVQLKKQRSNHYV